MRSFVALKSERGMLLFALFMLFVLTLVSIVARPMTPIDETRYIGVAWEMWLRGDFLVPFKNGLPYSHKPPLMIWLFQAGWAIFGANEWWPRLVSPLISVGNLLLTLALVRRLWPERENVGGNAVLILASCLLWTIFSTSAMFDIILAFFTLIGMHGTLLAAEGKSRRGMGLLAVSIGLGVLTKGPVILLHVLPVALLAPWWKLSSGLRLSRWYAEILVAVLLGAAIALLWAIPAGFAGGEAYRRAIFWGQTADRMVESFAHRRPIWWYLPLLPVMFFPWLVWPGLWSGLKNFVGRELDRGGRFCLAWMLPVIVVFSFISGKQPHYLIPIFPAFALLAARATQDKLRLNGLWLPVLLVISLGVAFICMAKGLFGHSFAGLDSLPSMWPGALLIVLASGAYLVSRRLDELHKPIVVLALLGVIVSAFVQLAFFRQLYAAYDVRPISLAIKQTQDSGHVVAHMGMYHDQYHFAGRLQAPLHEEDDVATFKTWLIEHPEAYAVVYTKNVKRLQGVEMIASQRYLSGAVVLLDAQTALSVLATQGALSGNLD